MCLNVQKHSRITYLDNYKSMSYSCMTSWRLKKYYSTANEQPSCD